ncbi:Eco57I restriction-modification methylase domain-containing protein [Brumimicrobium aurantiacum]|uniref:site-specific DNA-methyltransferase (adenine-specific) n=1 Tax=Brumimicrobium aurantiacum TaxID=1737063 RepID=A0A3E1EUI0_9FLAO|nr:N-6 DNA methylase [Brumimicrobium aurantiacum]RFC53188.1 restriction endonuclease subunit M [Brumimicrobium aurantiacum]
MALFQSSVLKSHLALLNEKDLEKAYKKYKTYFHNTKIQENIKKAKEEQFQATFLNELFVNVLGYTLFPNPNPNLTTEFKNEKNARKADGAILNDGIAVGVIELKGTKTKDLESIRQQAFDYKANHKECVYVITSNFEKLRFYISDATEYEEFDLFTLSRERFNLLYLCLHYNHIKTNTPLNIKEASIAEEEEITKSFYQDYSVFKRELYRDLVRNNSKTVKEKLSSNINEEEQLEIARLEKNVKLTLFKKSQKLIDRFLFVFFAEDRNLLPSNSTLQILNKWKDDQDFGDDRPLYDLFKQYFNFLDTGRKGTKSRAEIYAYNGGLFKPDSILDALEIDNDLLYKYTLKLSNYDFESQVDVNILGHIFENSLNEIESVNAEIEGGDFDKQTSKRKKDGVFYTPKYITKYIVENTVGKLCNEKKEELGFEEEQYFKGRKNRADKTLKKLVNILDDYREWLLELTICDPACGSGAFLNQALDFLIKEHSYIDELKARVLGGGLQFPDIENTILENNIYGVDLNDESVEIAKLSLWLRTAQPRRKLNDLSSNVKCGNSLIDDKKVAGDKAFNWEKEFPDVFEKGGFDVVIGNPPYVRVQNIDINSRNYFSDNYYTAFKNYDLYVLFTEKIKDILNSTGKASYIMPNKFITTEYGEKLKKFLFEKNFLSEYIDFSNFQIFDDATTYTGIFIFDNNSKQSINYFKINNDPLKFLNSVSFTSVNYENIKGKRWVFMDDITSKLYHKLGDLEKIKNSKTELFVGLQTSADPVFILEIKGDRLYSKHTGKYYDFGESAILKPLLKGGEIKRYSTPKPNYKLIFPYIIEGDDFRLLSEQEMNSNYQDIWNYLIECKLKLEGRENGKMKNDRWYGYVYLKNMTLFDKPKILTQVLCKQSSLSMDLNDNNYFVGGGTAGGYGISISGDLNPYSLIAILNSRLAQWYIKQFASPFQGGYYAYNKGTIGEIPLPNSYNNQDSHEKIVSKIKEKNDAYNDLLLRFLNYLQSQYSIGKFSRKLQNWNELDFSDFIKELNKAINKENRERRKNEEEEIPKLSKKDEFEWMELFEENKKKAVELQTQIDTTEKEIDEMVYELYGLSEEEIRIVENS